MNRPFMKSMAPIALAVLAAGCIAAWIFARTAFLAAYLASWWFCCALVMGGLSNVWVHNLTGGRWGEAIRAPLLELSRGMWLLALLFLPVLLGMNDLYAWAPHAAEGAGRWAGELPVRSAGFKSMWLMPWFFALRSVLYLAVWTLLAHWSRQPSLRRSPRFAAAALIAYGFTVGLAAVDWVMSLMPLWYSSVFGLLAGVGQALAGMALAVVLVVRMRPAQSSIVLRDLGNFLMMYVLTWAYLAFTQFLIIWAENLPHEIAWYVARMQNGWLVVAWLLALFHFFAPLLILLFRNVKEAPVLLGWLAAALLATHLLDVWWMILPSVSVGWTQWLWSVPLASATFAVAAWVLAKRGNLLHAQPAGAVEANRG
jgi:hypothetical protein